MLRDVSWVSATWNYFTWLKNFQVHYITVLILLYILKISLHAILGREFAQLVIDGETQNLSVLLRYKI